MTFKITHHATASKAMGRSIKSHKISYLQCPTSKDDTVFSRLCPMHFEHGYRFNDQCGAGFSIYII